MEKSYRIHTNIISDTVLNVNMQQDFDFLEVLSLRLRQTDAYKLHSSNYGVIVGRVLANDAFGVPNAKVSVFIERETSDTTEMENIYPYTSTTSKDKNDVRYNVLPDYSDDSCYRVVGTFPNKRLMLDDDTQLEVFDKYWKYTTVTNHAGDYMIFGVPTGNQTLHIDIDLSDIGILSQKPRDFFYKGYDSNLFDSAEQFKESTNLDNLTQIISQNKSVQVYPFWGDSDNGIAAITRSDIQVNYKFEPTCVFMGSIISDNGSNSIDYDCDAEDENGMNHQLIGGRGTIEMIRKTTDGLVEEYAIQGNQLIDEDGVWCYQIPMNLDYVGTDEYGNVVPTDNPNTGIPTRTQVRFRFSKTETGDEGYSRHTAKYLVPMNPVLDEDKKEPAFKDKGADVEKMYNFGSNTPDSCFRDLYWNNVYSVKNFIPRTQVAHRVTSIYYTALKGSNNATDQNNLPFNKLRVDLPFTYMIICILVTIVMSIIWAVNAIFISPINCIVLKPVNWLGELCLPWPLSICPFGFMKVGYIGCISMAAGLVEDNVVYFPGCWCQSGMDDADCPEDVPDCIKETDTDDFLDKMQRKLAKEFEIIKLDFYNDWLNGSLYMPLWYWRKRNKSYFLFIFPISAKNEFCSDKRTYSRLKTKIPCAMQTSYPQMEYQGYEADNKKWHKSSETTATVIFKRGLIKPVDNKDGLKVYYYSAAQVNASENTAAVIMDQQPAGVKMVRLYATDIILLGNFNEKNLYGIPQLYKHLPDTTANIPPIATIQENKNTTDSTNQYDSNDYEESGTTVITGMDWGHDGDKQVPQYKEGLFMDLACTSIITRAKACVNVERLSELGGYLDSRYKIEYSDGNSVKYGEFHPDGFINKLELSYANERAMFATLNHIGFIPQTYLESINYYSSQIPDENTSYYVNKFKYIYPVNFDGRNGYHMSQYQNGFEQVMKDKTDQNYITFRMGAEEETSKSSNSEGRIRHVYESNNLPLYNNSFYFFFGINKGSTAIDKFNNLYSAECYQTNKEPFSLDYEKKNVSLCPEVYADKKKGGYGWIKVTLDDISSPYSYTLYDPSGSEVISEENMTVSEFVIGGTYDAKTDMVTTNDNGTIKYIKTGKEIESGKKLSGHTYTLEVIDSNSKTMSTKIDLSMEDITADFNAQSLGTKFYNATESTIGSICNDTYGFYGQISFSSVTVDNYPCVITGVRDVECQYETEDTKKDGKKRFKFNVILKDEDNKVLDSSQLSATIILTLQSSQTGEKDVVDCLCDEHNRHNTGGMSFKDTSHVQHNYSLWFEDGMVYIYVYQPCKVSARVKLNSYCNGSENYSTSIISVDNGANFNGYLSDMPLRFMNGTESDSYFYSTSSVTNATDKHLAGWYAINDERAYKFAAVTEANKDVWKDFTTLSSNNITDSSSELDVLAYKFKKMFAISKNIFVTSSGSINIQFSTTGGVSPVLYRSVLPNYDSITDLITGQYILSESATATFRAYYPMLVGNNYSGVTSSVTGPILNPLLSPTNKNIGNYFAAFDKNGGYVGKTKLSEKINCRRVPSEASVSPYNSNSPVKIGEKTKANLTMFNLAYNSGTQHLKNDIQRSTKPYMRAMALDRRISASLEVFGPVTLGETQRINKYQAGINTDKVLTTCRLKGTIYGGLEMAYDNDYNIISADTVMASETSVSQVTPNNRLEYSYQLTNGQDNTAFTIYNNRNFDKNKNCVWSDSVEYGYDSEIDTADKPLIKQLYSATLADHDIRNFFWSTFNQNRLNQYIAKEEADAQKLMLTDNKIYVWKYPGKDITKYANGDIDPFDESGNYQESLIKSNYPTKRYIDISGIEGDGLFSLELSNCAYSKSVTNTGSGVLTSTTSQGGEETVDFSFGTPISFITNTSTSSSEDSGTESNSGYTDDGHAEYSYAKKTEGGYYVFTNNKLNANFKYASASMTNYNVYTACPILFVVKESSMAYDFITAIKTSNVDGEGLNLGGDGVSVDALLSITAIKRYLVTTYGNDWIDRLLGASVYPPEGISVYRASFNDTNYYSFWNNNQNKPVTSSEDLFTQISFKTSVTNVANRLLAVYVQRFCTGNQSDMLSRSVITHEFSEIIDTRKIKLKPLMGTTTDPYSYMEGSTDITQHVTFEFMYNNITSATTADPMSLECQAFANIDTYYAHFNKGDKSYYVEGTAESATTDDVTTIKVEFSWDYDDNQTLIDGGWTCAVFAQTESNFKYKVGNFNIRATGTKPVGDAKSITTITIY